MLVRHFTTLVVKAGRVSEKRFDEDALSRLEAMEWPGNVRELRNAVERLLILAPGNEIAASDVDLLSAGRGVSAGLGADLLGAGTFSEFKERAERAFILQRLREHDWNVSGNGPDRGHAPGPTSTRRSRSTDSCGTA